MYIVEAHAWAIAATQGVCYLDWLAWIYTEPPFFQPCRYFIQTPLQLWWSFCRVRVCWHYDCVVSKRCDGCLGWGWQICCKKCVKYWPENTSLRNSWANFVHPWVFIIDLYHKVHICKIRSSMGMVGFSSVCIAVLRAILLSNACVMSRNAAVQYSLFSMAEREYSVSLLNRWVFFSKAALVVRNKLVSCNYWF